MPLGTPQWGVSLTTRTGGYTWDLAKSGRRWLWMFWLIWLIRMDVISGSLGQLLLELCVNIAEDSASVLGLSQKQGNCSPSSLR